MAQLPPGFVLEDDMQSAGAPSGPVFGAPAKPETPPAPKTTFRTLTPQEVQERGLPQGNYQVNSEGKVDPIGSTTAPNPGPGFMMTPQGTAAPIPGSDSDPVARQKRTALSLIEAAGIDTAKGFDPVAGLIKGSTSGMVQKLGADMYGAVTGDATSGMENIGRLETIVADLTLSLAPNGSLGAQISDGDRKFYMQRLGDLADASSPADKRLAAWEQVKARLAKQAGLDMKAVGFQEDKSAAPAFYRNGGAYDKDGNYLGLTDSPDGPAGGPPSGGGGGSAWQAIGAGVGDVVQGVGDVPGLLVNPIGQLMYNAMPGDQGTYDLGQILRDSMGLPASQNPTVSAINRGGAAALTGAGVARGLTSIASPGAAQNALAIFGANPLADTAAGAAAGGASEGARQAGAGATGQVGAALLGGLAGYKGASAAGARALGQRTPNALMQNADSLGVQMLPADVGGVGTRMATGAFGRTLGGIPIAEGAQNAIGTAAAARTRIASNIGEATDPAGAGQSIKRGFDAFTKSSKDRADTLYGKISVAPDASVELANTRTALTQVTQGLKSNPELSRLWVNHPRLRDSLEALTPTDTSGAGQIQFRMASQKLTSAQDAYDQLRNQVVPAERLAQARKAIDDARTELDNAQITANRPAEGGKLSWQDMNRFRSIVGEIIGQPGVSRDGSDIAALRKLYGALTTDMEATAAQAGPRALTEFRRATQYWRGREARIDDVFATLLGKEGKRSDEAVFQQINSWAKGTTGDFKRVSQAIRSMPEDEASTVRATLVQRMGMAPARRQDVTQEVFSPAEFAAQWNGMSPRAKSALFPNQQHRQDLDKLAGLMDAMKRADQFQNFSNTSLGTNLTAQGALAWANLPAALSLALAQFGAGKLLASPRFARAIASTYRLPETAGRQKLTEQLKVVASREPLIANDVKGVLEFINKGMAQSPTSAAAQDEANGRRVPPQQ